MKKIQAPCTFYSRLQWNQKMKFLHCINLASLKFRVSSLPIMRDTSTDPDDRISLRDGDNTANSITKCLGRVKRCANAKQ